MKNILTLLVLASALLLFTGCNEDTIDRTPPPTVELPVEEAKLPCPDTRDGTFPQSSVPSTCYASGYFYCSIAGLCLDKPMNVNVCGEIGSAQREAMNAGY